MKKIIACVIILMLLTYYSGLSIKDRITDHYYVVAVDVSETASVGYYDLPQGGFWESGNPTIVIDATVFAVGHNDNYIIAKQHPRGFSRQPDKSITNYFILPLIEGMNWKTKNGLIGPLTLEQFQEKRKYLKIPDDLTFTYVLEYLE